jgi:hypothetical protein
MKSKMVPKNKLRTKSGEQYEGMNAQAAKQIKGASKMYKGIKDKAHTVLIADKRRKGQTVAITKTHEILENNAIKSGLKKKYKDAHKYAEKHETIPLSKALKIENKLICNKCGRVKNNCKCKRA